MKSPLVVLTSILACSIAVPVLVSITSYRGIDLIDSTGKQVISISKNSKKKEINYETVDKESPVITIYNTKLGKNQDMDIEEYLCGVLAGEMPSDFDIEALKAQAVAARTFVKYKESQGKSKSHPNAVVCTDYSDCQEYKSYDELKSVKGEEWMKESYPKIQQAVKETKGQIITYDGNPILTLYFSTSGGKTENSSEVFSSQYPYLKSVESPYDKLYSPKYTSVLSISNQDFVSYLKKSYNDIQIDASKLKSQVKVLNRSEGGSVESIKLGNKEITGRDVRNIFGLNSANFEITFGKDTVDFNVKGYGHGVGMSQWGAEGMAQEGYVYYEILEHYYTGTKIIDTY
ncbi:MAG: stage II sporulation protein D [Peptostreptococcaceae bacterium]